MGLGGIRTASDAMEFIIAGATAVAVGTATFIDPASTVKIAEGIRKYCVRKNKNVRELIGSLQI
jgi:dihydroorotate dehydrogenase (NAD+) catalytic subunit